MINPNPVFFDLSINGSKTIRENAGVDVAKICDLKEICHWKFELMARKIFSGLWGDRKDILDNISSIYSFNLHEETNEIEILKIELEQKLEQLYNKLKRLTRMRLEDEITKSGFLEYKMEIETERDNLIKKRAMLEEGNSNISDIDDPTKKITDFDDRNGLH